MHPPGFGHCITFREETARVPFMVKPKLDFNLVNFRLWKHSSGNVGLLPKGEFNLWASWLHIGIFETFEVANGAAIHEHDDGIEKINFKI